MIGGSYPCIISLQMKQRLEAIYSLLLSKFGHRSWWPGDTKDEIIIGAILTQNVSWRNVKQAIGNLNQNHLLTLKAIHEADTDEIAPLIKSTRFYNQKTDKLKSFAQFLFGGYDGSLDLMFMEDVESLRAEMLKIKGLGEETVDSILLYAGGKSIFVIDAYTVRIFSRLGLTEEKWSYGKYQRFFMDHLDHDTDLFNDYHAQIVHLGHLYCHNNSPECGGCPLGRLCRFH